MASSEILSQTLFSITKSKLLQLDKQRRAYETGKRQLEEKATAETADDGKRTRTLITGAKSLPTMTLLSKNPMISLSNLERFMQQAQNDSSVTKPFILACEASVHKELGIQSTKYEYASLYGKLVNEWISLGQKDEKDAVADASSVGREEARIQRATWEEYAFHPKQTDQAAIKTYLAGIFESEKVVKGTLDRVRELVRFFECRLNSDSACFDAATVDWAIRGLLRSDTLTDIKRSTLNDFLGNKVVISEVADVLNMRMKTRGSWEWEEDLIIDQRRNLSGRYRFYPDEDLLQSIFIYYIGMEWANTLRLCFECFLDLESGVWKPTLGPISCTKSKRLEKMMGMRTTPYDIDYPTIHNIKEKHFKEDIFLDQLPRSLGEQRGAYGSKNDVEVGDTCKSQLEVTQKLLHMIQADIIVASGGASPSTSNEAQGKRPLVSSSSSAGPVPGQENRLGKPVTVIRSDFKWFGPSIPHSSITAVLEYFGVSKEWLDFFVKILEAPLRFKQDADNVPSRTRKRGSHIGTPLADALGESLLFCVDFAVNQKAEGVRLYRLHDDMWLWGDKEACQRSWTVLTECAEILGLDFNMEKTGSATVRSYRGSSVSTTSDARLKDTLSSSITTNSDLDAVLPQGDVTWGFLKLDPISGRFVIRQEEVDKHIDELRLQLDACKSVFDWIQAWNMYGVQFFTNFFGQPANCYSRQHIDSMMDTFQRIQRTLFPDAPGGAGEHLKTMISKRFGMTAGEIPDGYVYFPVELGGLGLKNPFVSLCLVRDSVQDPNDLIGNDAEAVEEEYQAAKVLYDGRSSPHGQFPSKIPFMKMEEYSRHRERLSSDLGRKYEALMLEPTPVDVELRGELKAILTKFQWNEMSSYDKWVVSLYGREMLAKFGGIHVVEKGLLPMGMMNMLRQSKFQWLG